MDLQISGTVKQVLDLQTGKGKNGPWKKQDFILETPGKFPRLVCVTQWGDQIDKNDIKEGDALTAFIDLQSREYKGRWYTDVKAWKIEKGEGGTPPASGPDEKVIDFGPGGEGEAPF